METKKAERDPLTDFLVMVNHSAHPKLLREGGPVDRQRKLIEYLREKAPVPYHQAEKELGYNYENANSRKKWFGTYSPLKKIGIVWKEKHGARYFIYYEPAQRMLYFSNMNKGVDYYLKKLKASEPENPSEEFLEEQKKEKFIREAEDGPE